MGIEHREIVGQDEAGKTVAAVVRRILGDVPWSRARSLCATGRVRVDGSIEFDSAARVRAGSVVSVAPSGPKQRSQALPAGAILHVDHHIVVVDKPAGVVTVPFATGERDTLVHRVRAALAGRDHGRGPGGGGPPLRVVQRLDKDTSGVLVFARTRKAERELQRQLREHSASRTYLAIVHGRARAVTWDTIIVSDRGDGLRGSWGSRPEHRGARPPGGKRAITHVDIEQLLEDATLVSCRLETGRQHQIRIHLAEAGNPIVGERVYIRDFTGPIIDAPRPMLHATNLQFTHPATSLPMHFRAEPPPDFEATFARLRR